MVPTRKAPLPVAAFVTALAMTTASSADVPGPKPRCDVEGRGCTECWRSYSADPSDRERFDACAEPAKGKGLVEACHHRQGAGDAVFFCPAGVKIETKIVGGGCAGCATGEGAPAGALAAIAAGLAAAVGRRRKARRG